VIAYQLHGEQDLRVEDIPVPDVGPGDVKVRIAHNGICGSDLHFFYASARDGWPRPRHIGHEASGVVTEVGSAVTDVAVGDRVCLYPIDSCGSCRQCIADYPVLCEVFDRSVSTIGCGAPIGGLAEFCVVPSRLIIPLPDELSLAEGALVEPLAVGTTAVQRAQIAANNAHIVILGGGPIGIGIVLALEALGISQFIVVEPTASRREALHKLTTAQIIDPTTEDVASTVRTWSGDHGADVVFECAGVPASLDCAFAVVRKRGKIVLIGLFEKTYTLLPNPVAVKEITIVGHNGSTKKGFRTVIQWMVEGRIPTEQWVRHVPFDRTVEEGFEPLRKGEQIKILIDLPPS
jgi:(R,R)-butanediol dehydrogenase / meso-butanediol dehydrogenase / diacetyl reductase